MDKERDMDREGKGGGVRGGGRREGKQRASVL